MLCRNVQIIVENKLKACDAFVKPAGVLHLYISNTFYMNSCFLSSGVGKS